MFVGHYAAAMAAKAIEPKAPMWTLAAASQLVDIGWSTFIIAGVERARVDPTLPGSTLVLYDMPWTHSLPAALVWSVAAALLVKLLLRLPNLASVMVGLTVFSHWLLDFLVHRPDLEGAIEGPLEPAGQPAAAGRGRRACRVGGARGGDAGQDRGGDAGAEAHRRSPSRRSCFSRRSRASLRSWASRSCATCFSW